MLSLYLDIPYPVNDALNFINGGYSELAKEFLRRSSIRLPGESRGPLVHRTGFSFIGKASRWLDAQAVVDEWIPAFPTEGSPWAEGLRECRKRLDPDAPPGFLTSFRPREIQLSASDRRPCGRG